MLQGSSTYVAVDPLFDDGGDAMVALAKRAERYRTYSSHEKLDSPVGAGLFQRHDSVLNFLRTGGRHGRTDLAGNQLLARTGYLREEYAYDGVALTDGIEAFLHSERLLAAARQVHGRPEIAPSIAYANVMLPGQELAVHTDVPEFRGLNRKLVPQWLLVVMHHSGLFDRWRMPIATGVSWFSGGKGGELSLWPDGPAGSSILHDARPNTALVLDTDTLFHGVDPVGGPDVEPPPISGDSELRRVGAAGERWELVDGASGETRATYGWEELRLSVSWKAYCFADAAERDAWRTHAEDLTEEAVLDALVADLVERGLAQPDVARDGALGLLLIETYVRYPAPA